MVSMMSPNRGSTTFWNLKIGICWHHFQVGCSVPHFRQIRTLGLKRRRNLRLPTFGIELPRKKARDGGERGRGQPFIIRREWAWYCLLCILNKRAGVSSAIHPDAVSLPTGPNNWRRAV